MYKGNIAWLLQKRAITVSMDNIIDNAKAYSGGYKDVNFLKYLIDNKILIREEFILKRQTIGVNELYYTDKYIKMSMESDRHFLCRTKIQAELSKLGVETISDISIGNLDILNASSNYDIITDDFTTIIDVGLTPARNFFRGLTELKVKNYFITTYFDDYMDDIIFCSLSRDNDETFINAVREYVEGHKEYHPNPQPEYEERKFNNQPTF